MQEVPMDERDLLRAVSILDGFPGSWWVTGGWAIDLACPAPVRDHSDVDLLVRDDEADLLWDHLRGRDPVIEHPHSRVRRDWRRGDVLTAGPDTIVLDGFPGLQILVGRFEGDVWIFPRGSGRIRRPVGLMTRYGRHGLPIQAPEVVLLFKARDRLAKNDLDFSAVADLLDDEQRAWLRPVIARRTPDHPWLSRL
ncbi:nucleotidyltransferase domain-containing protein [Microlunatus sp. GCM10028923]|uniref:nucleotidyltransferase domain-containing protein n=1 Tax=Microlunatus sp. GCM10028923 TaxID=3273400 RepID=UPI00361A8CA3